MGENFLIGIALVMVVGVTAQWVAARISVPSIVLLLLSGFVVGPILGLVDPDALFGDLLTPLVSASVAIILFEGGLTLRIRDLPVIGSAVRNLVSIGALATWIVSALAGRYILGLDWQLSILLGSILTVTGPTVIIPLLRFVGPVGPAGSVLRWEGIVIDPIGATLAVLVFEAIVSGEAVGATTTTTALIGFLRTAFVGGITGIVGAALLIVPLRRYLVPDSLQNAVTLTVVIAIFTLSDALQHESGLLAVTVMGIALANQKDLMVKHIVEFKENLQVLLLAALFILLSARLPLEDITQLSLQSIAFLAVLILVARPIGVALSTIGSGLSTKERLFIAWMAPRGIVAAAISSIFSLRLVEVGYPGAERLVALTFLVIVGTVLVYGFTAKPLATWLGLTEKNSQGVLVVGAHHWARRIAAAIRDAGYSVLLADTNMGNISQAEAEGFRTHYGNILFEHTYDEMDLTGIGRMIALTSNDAVNSLAALHLAELFGRMEVYQLSTQGGGDTLSEQVPRPLRGRILFGSGITFDKLERMFDAGAELRSVPVEKDFDLGRLDVLYGAPAMPVFLVSGSGNLHFFTRNNPPRPRSGQTLVSLVCPDGIDFDLAPLNAEIETMAGAAS